MESLLEILNLKDNAPIAILGLFLWYTINSFKSNTKENFDRLDSKIDSVRTELKSEINKLDAKIDKVDSKIDRIESSLRSEIQSLSHDVHNLDKTVIRFESNKDAETRFESKIEKLLTNVISSKPTQNQQL